MGLIKKKKTPQTCTLENTGKMIWFFSFHTVYMFKYQPLAYGQNPDLAAEVERQTYLLSQTSTAGFW